MAVTVHYCYEDDAGKLCLRAELVAFRHIRGEHSGENLAKYFVDILKELGLQNRVSSSPYLTSLFPCLFSSASGGFDDT
jgi:hypothetical protein